MGSGAFLVEVMRQLAGCWSRRGTATASRLASRATRRPILFASRLIAQRCLYGVDKNRMAVDLAKLSLWLATLAKDHAFSFLDHNFRHGDSLVGLSLAQIEACHWAPDVQQAFVSRSLRNKVAVAMKRRQEILSADDLTSYERLSDLRRRGRRAARLPPLSGRCRPRRLLRRGHGLGQRSGAARI